MVCPQRALGGLLQMDSYWIGQWIVMSVHTIKLAEPLQDANTLILGNSLIQMRLHKTT